MKTLNDIIKTYSSTSYNRDNYHVGGGMTDTGKKASNRHENALSDIGKLTFGKAAQMFKKATGKDIVIINEVFNYAVACPEWHHAGFMPKKFGGGMKKTYFLNANEIVMIATNWQQLIEKLEISKESERTKQEYEKHRTAIKQTFLNKYAERVIRVTEQPKYFYETDREMDGKYGWFSSYGKSYNMTEYYSGWKFKSEKKYKEFYSI